MVNNDSWISAQSACITSVLLYPNLTEKLLQETTVEDFEGAPAGIYRIIRELRDAGNPPDPVIINARAQGLYSDYLSQLVNDVPVFESQFERYLEEVHRQSRCVRAQRLMGEAIAEGNNLESVRDIAQQVSEVIAETNGTKSVSLSVLSQNFLENLKAEPEYIPTGMRQVDKRLHYRKSNLNVIAARPGIGKTALGLQMALCQSRKYRVGYFTLEGSEDEIMERIVARQARVSWSKISDRNLNAADMAGVQSALEELNRNENLRIYPAAGWSAADIVNAAIADKLEIIYVDYIQLCAGSRKDGSMSRYEIVTESSMELRALANKRKISVFAMAQLNRSGTGRPSLENLRESGQLEQDADTVAFIYEETNDGPNLRTFEVMKNRHGEKGHFKLKWDGGIQKFSYDEPKVGVDTVLQKEKYKNIVGVPEYVYTPHDEED